MRSIKIEVVRTITTSTTYVIKISDGTATKFLKDAPSMTKEEIAERAEDMYQCSKRKIETFPYTKREEVDNTEVINYARFRDCTGDN